MTALKTLIPFSTKHCEMHGAENVDEKKVRGWNGIEL